MILVEGFKDLNKLTININNNAIKSTKIIKNHYKINTKGVFTIKYKINTDNDFEMEKMFKNIKYLKTIEMNSDNNITLKSINSAFNGCSNLESFKMKGFNRSDISSFKKLFHKTNLSYIDLKENVFDAKNAEDMSFIFSGTKIKTLIFPIF